MSENSGPVGPGKGKTKKTPTKKTPTPTPTPSRTPSRTPTPTPTQTPSDPVQQIIEEQESNYNANSFNRYDDQSVIIGWSSGGRPGSAPTPITLKGAEAKDRFKNGLYSNDPGIWDTVSKLYSMGIIKGTPGTGSFIDNAISAYNRLVDRAAGNKTLSVLDIASYHADSANGTTQSTGSGSGGKSIFKSYAKYTDEQAKKLAQETYQLYLGREATATELVDFQKALLRAAKAAPSVQITKSGKGGTTSQTTSQGFNEASWVTGYISARVGLDQIDEVAGQMGTINDEFERYQELYGYRPTKMMRLQDTQNVLQGKTKLEDIEARYREQAKALFPALREALDRGMNVRQIADTKISAKARILEQPEEKINLYDPDIVNALSTKNERGEFVSMTDDEFARTLYKKPEWLQTKNAKETMRGAAEDIIKEFGFRR
jgi:hypothetical protein